VVELNGEGRRSARLHQRTIGVARASDTCRSNRTIGAERRSALAGTGSQAHLCRVQNQTGRIAANLAGRYHIERKLDIKIDCTFPVCDDGVH
jgi:hypothetical protein